jgi:peptidoglycan/LPS O-acetylase OafA/YrhL
MSTSTPETDLLTRPLAPAETKRKMPRLPVLDGWRGISILLVLAAHLLPLGPKRFELNEAVAKMGMAIFFTLSGFLITSTLFFDPSARNFAVRRFFRILPGAWLYLLIVLVAVRPAPAVWAANLLFTVNSPPFLFVHGLTEQFWSLGVEVQFYLFIGVLFLILRQRALALLPFVCIAVTLGRVHAGETTSIRTIYRVDEILSGASLAYLFHSNFSTHLRAALTKINPLIPLALLCLGSYHGLAPLQYLRPYFACIAVGTTLFHEGTGWNRFLESKPLAYLAAVSYALYVWHLMTTVGWFHEGSKVMIYAKRPLGLSITFLIAHLSTFYWEKYWTGMGKKLMKKKPADKPVAA